MLEAALKDLKGNPILHELIARVYFITENFEKSIIHNKKAAELQPDRCFHNWSDVGLGFYRLGLQQVDNKSKHFETAFKFCRQSLEQNPSHANAMVNMGLVYRSQPNGTGDSHKMFKAAHEADPGNLGALVNLGCIDYEFSNYEDAAIWFLDALEVKPDDEEALCNLALALKKTLYLDYA